MTEKTSCYILMILQHVQGASIVDFRIDDILILSGADFWPGIDQFITQGFFPFRFAF